MQTPLASATTLSLPVPLPGPCRLNWALHPLGWLQAPLPSPNASRPSLVVSCLLLRPGASAPEVRRMQVTRGRLSGPWVYSSVWQADGHWINMNGNIFSQYSQLYSTKWSAFILILAQEDMTCILNVIFIIFIITQTVFLEMLSHFSRRSDSDPVVCNLQIFIQRFSKNTERLPLPSPGVFLDPGTSCVSFASCMAGRFLLTSTTWEAPWDPQGTQTWGCSRWLNSWWCGTCRCRALSDAEPQTAVQEPENWDLRAGGNAWGPLGPDHRPLDGRSSWIYGKGQSSSITLNRKPFPLVLRETILWIQNQRE